MSKVQFLAAIPDTGGAWVSDFAKKFEMTKFSGDTATFTSELDNKVKIEVSGKNLDVKLGELAGGKVTSFEMTYDGETYLKGSETSLKAAAVQEFMETAGAGLLIKALEGRDTVTGSSDHDMVVGLTGEDRLNGKGGDDQLHGGEGDDRLTGGGGADVFEFYFEDNSRDVITDFDASGGVGDQDLLDLKGYAYQVTKLGKDNTLITFDDEEIVLLGVKPSEIDETDFVV
jgi:Ca2+-binding RTX toxin-like protein